MLIEFFIELRKKNLLEMSKKKKTKNLLHGTNFWITLQINQVLIKHLLEPIN